MPELPEVESSRRLLESVLLGKRIVRAEAEADEKLFVDCAASLFCSNLLAGAAVTAVHRRGKHLWWTLADANVLTPLFHFGMTGSFAVRGVGATKYKSFSIDTSSWPPKFSKLTLELSDGTAVAFTDPRRFARIRLLRGDPTVVAPVSGLGPDMLLSPPSLEAWTKCLASRSASIKAVLLDQSVACGVGNWVADEALFQASVHPESPANALSPQDVAAVLDCCVRVCREACAVDADSDRFPPHWLFHVRWGKKAGKTSTGHAIAFETVGGRTSCYVPALQKKVGSNAAASKGKSKAVAVDAAQPAPVAKRGSSAAAEAAADDAVPPTKRGKNSSKAAAPAAVGPVARAIRQAAGRARTL
jgi:formamidopyrimidine-DNA glycosylase